MFLPNLHLYRSPATRCICLLLLAILHGCAVPEKNHPLPQIIERTSIPDTHEQAVTPVTPSSPSVQAGAVEPHKKISFRDYRLTTASVTDATIADIFAAAKELVEQHTKTDLSAVQLTLASNRTIQDEVRYETRRLVSSQFHNSVYAEKFLQRMVDDQASSYAALYTDRGNRVMVSRPLLSTYLSMTEQAKAQLAPAVAALLIHELVHAADDVRYNIHKNRVMNFKISFTQSAAFEGHAQLVTREICTLHDCLEGMRSLERFMFAPVDTSDPVAQSVQAISRNVLEYSYIEGERFLTALQQRPDGEQLIDQVLRNPPADPIQILVPETYPDTDREARNNRLRNAIHNAGHPWTLSPWTIIETSPIKGINVRDQPERRSAAIEGFTRLIVAMESAQIYKQSELSLAPVDLTLIEADSADTANMFAESFRQHVAQSTAVPSRTEPLGSNELPGVSILYYTPAKKHGESDRLTVVATHGRHVLQLNGPAVGKQSEWLAFAREVMRRSQVELDSLFSQR